MKTSTKTTTAPKKTPTPDPVRDAAIAWAHKTLSPELAATFAKAKVRRGDALTWMHIVADAADTPAADRYSEFVAEAREILGMGDVATAEDVHKELVSIRRALDARHPATTPGPATPPAGESPRTDADREAERVTLRRSKVEAHNRHYEMTIGDLVAGMVCGTPSAANPAPSLLSIVSTLVGLLQIADEVDGGISDSFRERVTSQIRHLAQYGAELTSRVARARGAA